MAGRLIVAGAELADPEVAPFGINVIIAAADSDRPSFRLVLGSTVYTSIRNALTDRLQAIEARRDVAYSADAD